MFNSIIRSRNSLHFMNAAYIPGFWWGSCLFIVLVVCVVLYFCLVCLRSVSSMSNVASVSRFSIPGLPLRFSLTFIFSFVPSDIIIEYI